MKQLLQHNPLTLYHLECRESKKIDQITIPDGEYILPYYFPTKKQAKYWARSRTIRRMNENLQTIRGCLDDNKRETELLKSIEAIKV